MKIAVALIAAGFVASFAAVTPANAQKDPACIEKCNRSNVAGGGGMQSRGTAQAVRGRQSEIAWSKVATAPAVTQRSPWIRFGGRATQAQRRLSACRNAI